MEPHASHVSDSTQGGHDMLALAVTGPRERKRDQEKKEEIRRDRRGRGLDAIMAYRLTLLTTLYARLAGPVRPPRHAPVPGWLAVYRYPSMSSVPTYLSALHPRLDSTRPRSRGEDGGGTTWRNYHASSRVHGWLAERASGRHVHMASAGATREAGWKSRGKRKMIREKRRRRRC
ncbi:hypothetical protein BS50DRAFT_223562 [Corynespora cassiicola Philippines]|uniref:Uncharacterized protein n=1 Tax=Corynespora cassiicola Philippines TaxID=1448308 RepID=A0A2T2N2S7_CORCC|nr:hypothetical protein BS50DRAFT_223562 [Corynespora cassiicola Philippines]